MNENVCVFFENYYLGKNPYSVCLTVLSVYKGKCLNGPGKGSSLQRTYPLLTTRGRHFSSFSI